MQRDQAEQIMSAARQAVVAIDQAQQAGTPLQIADARARALIDGLMAIAELAGANLERPYYIDPKGEVAVFGKQDFRDGPSAPYGDVFAGILSQVPRRTGVRATSADALPENGWCWVNHFDLEAMIRGVAGGKGLSIDVRSPVQRPDQGSFGPSL